MDLIDKMREMASRIPSQLPHLETEEATKTALVMPFISFLGYDVFNPTEVLPEFTADVGTKKGEKVDYAVMNDGQPIMLFECKSATSKLDGQHASQLYRYFSVTAARFGVLTNGIQYRFYSDLEEPNKMDERPFLEFDVTQLDDHAIEEIKRFAKQSFDLEAILSTASELKYTKGVLRLLQEEWVNPSEEFVRLFASRVYSGRLTQAAKDQFTQIVKRAFHDFINGRIKLRLQSALDRTDARDDDADKSDEQSTPEKEPESRDVETTSEELEGFFTVKAILRDQVDPARIFMRDTMSYCGILLDDNNRKPVCRLWFNRSKKYIGVFDEQKNETRHEIQGINDLFAHTNQLKKIVKYYDGDRSGETS